MNKLKTIAILALIAGSGISLAAAADSLPTEPDPTPTPIVEPTATPEPPAPLEPTATPNPRGQQPYNIQYGTGSAASNPEAAPAPGEQPVPNGGEPQTGRGGNYNNQHTK